MIDIKTVEYDVELITETGTRYLLNDALIELDWEEQQNELAQRATVTVANFRIDNTYLISLAKINCVIMIYAKWEGMTADPPPPAATPAPAASGGAEPKVGDTVEFLGGPHFYTSTGDDARGGNRTPGPAKLTSIARGAKHPYHLIGGAYADVPGTSNVYGWVDASQVKFDSDAPAATSAAAAQTNPAPPPGTAISRKLMFEGTIWEWQYVSATNKELTLTVYDRLIRIQQSRDFLYYSAGMTTQALIGDICGQWGIPLSYKWGKSLTHEKKVFSADRISDMIISLLEEVRQKSGEDYIAYFRDGQLQITRYGTNNPIYKFDSSNTIQTSDKLTINDLVTRVKIMGKQDDEGRAPVEAIVDGDTQYGVLQEIIRRDTNKTVEATMSEADALIKARGKPEAITQINVPDLPFLRKGDKIEVAAGNLLGFFFVEGVIHNATTRRMNITVSRESKESVTTTQTTTETGTSTGGGGTSNQTFQKGDAVILNGPTFVYSSGTPSGRTFNDYHTVITMVADAGSYAPYHVGAAGWARASDLTKG